MSEHKRYPPRLFLKFFRLYCDAKMQDYIEGDLMEVFERRLKKLGKTKADLLFVVDVLLLFRPGIIKPTSNYQHVTNYGMIKSYFKTGWRNLWRNKLYSTLNVTGLAFGIVCFLLIGLFVYDELTFDLQHTNAERIYRVVEHKNASGEETTIASAGFKLAEEAKNYIPEVENTARLWRIGRANLVDPENPEPFQETINIANQNFLEMFDFPLVAGDRHTALKEPNSIIINEDLAMRIFKSLDVLGRNVQFSHMQTLLKITGILRNHPHNSSFTFNSLMSESTAYNQDDFKETMARDWASNRFSVYTLLRPGSNADSVARKMTRLVLSNFSPPSGTTLAYSLQALPDMHLHSTGIVDGGRNSNVEAIAHGNPLYIKIFSFTAVFVLLIAGINYTNLTTARASGRIKEIGVRKTIGAIRSNLVGQFLIESLLTTIISFVLAVIIVKLMLPAFNEFIDKQLSLGISTGYRFWLIAAALVVLTGFLSGGYASLLLSRLNPVALLKGLKMQSIGDLSVRKGLVIFQFMISTVMIIGTIVLFMQVSYMNNAQLGFNKDLMVVIDVNVGKARTNFEVLKNEMAKIPAVKDVSVTSRVPGEWKIFQRVKLKNQGSTDDYQTAYYFGADRDFMKTYEVALEQGRNFDTRADTSCIIVNKTAAGMLNIAEVAGQVIDIGAVSGGGAFRPLNDNNVPLKRRVIGIVKDFHFQSLRDKIEPLVIAYNENPIQPIDYYSVKISSTDIPGTLEKLKAIMVRNDEREPFEYHFLDDQLALFYVEDERRQTILGWVALATIFIACLGLFGLATYSAEQRVKEIGVRKVLGATMVNLVSLLSMDFIKLVLIANAIAFPIAWWGTNRWLEEYAYHIDLKWWVFLLAAILATMIALLTVSYQAFRAAMSNPVKSLRTE
jgi:putative ABC transport system permease protein